MEKKKGFFFLHGNSGTVQAPLLFLIDREAVVHFSSLFYLLSRKLLYHCDRLGVERYMQSCTQKDGGGGGDGDGHDDLTTSIRTEAFK